MTYQDYLAGREKNRIYEDDGDRANQNRILDIFLWHAARKMRNRTMNIEGRGTKDPHDGCLFIAGIPALLLEIKVCTYPPERLQEGCFCFHFDKFQEMHKEARALGIPSILLVEFPDGNIYRVDRVDVLHGKDFKIAPMQLHGVESHAKQSIFIPFTSYFTRL